MFIGWMIFSGVAILCVVAGVVVMRRNRAYGNSADKADDIDFDDYEGFEK
jgi:hypothetical protein